MTQSLVGQLLARTQAAPLAEAFKLEEPVFVVGCCQILGRTHLFDAERDARQLTRRSRRGYSARTFALPSAHGRRVRLVRRVPGRDPRAAKVMRADHFASGVADRAGKRGKPTPIIKSRVTRSTSAASSHPSVPDGRIGSTRYLSSAVNPRPNLNVRGNHSAEFRQHGTRLEHDAASIGGRLYQTGGNPSTGHG